jgi:hypothetical protein
MPAALTLGNFSRTTLPAHDQHRAGRLNGRQRLLVHQVHPAKLGVDITASVVSTVLLWQHHLSGGLLVRYLLPPLGTLLVLSFGDVDRRAGTFAGQYILEHMPPVLVAIRLAGDTLMALGAWRRRPACIALAVLLIALGWSHGMMAPLLRRRRVGARN